MTELAQRLVRATSPMKPEETSASTSGVPLTRAATRMLKSSHILLRLSRPRSPSLAAARAPANMAAKTAFSSVERPMGAMVWARDDEGDES